MAVRVFGEIPGVTPGTLYPDRKALHDAGVHRPLQAGISGSPDEGADSIVISGGYEDDEDRGDVIIYTGHGGNDPATGRQVADQELDGGNQALVVSEEREYPVRVVRGFKGDPQFSPKTGYRYDGLYRVVHHWSEEGQSGFKVWRFELQQLHKEPGIATISRKARGMGGSEDSNRRGGGSKREDPDQKTESHRSDVSTALALVLETMAELTHDLSRRVSSASDRGSYGEARRLLNLAEQLSHFRDQAKELGQRWQALDAALGGQGPLPKRAKTSKRPVKKTRADYGKVSPQEKTSQNEYLQPILEVLVDLGGSARRSDVFDVLEQRMSASFTKADLEPLKSKGNVLRWRSTAAWARQQLVAEGLMDAQERGVWGISAAGRRRVEELRKSAGKAGDE